MIAALFVAVDGPYSNIANVQPWDELKDARKYTGPFPVVAHPPCERWGRYWGGGPSAKVKRILGDDNGCFQAALLSVRKFGGVLEHPADSKAWECFNLKKPNKKGGWSEAGDGIGFVCHVEQGHYGHRARKGTWLYANSAYLPELTWGPCGGKERLDEGFHSKEERAAKRALGLKPRPRLSVTENIHTPIKFRDALLEIAKLSRE